MKPNLITFKMPSHGSYSGYSRLADFIEADKIKPYKQVFYARILPAFIRQKLLSQVPLTWYSQNPTNLSRELEVIFRLLTKKPQIFHFLYGENSYFYTGKFAKLRGHKLIATYHLPPAVFSQYVHETDHLLELDAVIVVAQNQLPFFQQLMPAEKVFFVPHGIDTHFFRPQRTTKRKPNRCLFVGHFLRDFDILRKVIHSVRVKNPCTEFVVITKKTNLSQLPQDDKTIFKTGLSDTQLRQEYRQASLFIQSLQDATANNSILEALACGLPIVATDLGGVRDYLTGSCASFIPPNKPDKMSQEIIVLLENHRLRKQMSKESRKQALKFSWSKVAQKIKKVYQQILT